MGKGHDWLKELQAGGPKTRDVTSSPHPSHTSSAALRDALRWSRPNTFTLRAPQNPHGSLPGKWLSLLLSDTRTT